MKKLALTLVATLLMGTAALANPVKVGVAAEPYPPFTSPDASGNWVGWEVDFMNALCAKAEIECVLTPTAWDGIIPALTSGQIDMIMSSMSITDERKQTIDFTDKYYNTPAIVMAAKGSGITPTAEGLAGKIIGVQVSTIHENYVNKYFGPTAAEVKSYQTQDEANQDLAAGRIDAVMADSIALQAFLESDAGKACCENVGAVADDPTILGAGVGAGLRKGDPLLPKLNAAIAALREDGTYATITAKYFPFDIYGASN
ncbi:transporter substrate-binding domain-containing protein [Tabrizicola sp. J26]|uniref:transporter substrate-binding domain-containing protein n=1 Tax=Alitabrizicola rongguiensis TaxID=2909234 RepID=UPI001F419CEB|nr:transporter substrate-binding domain-containing protein [Tabrizicola rongguiensis]MCF1708651.1 transporter substrate-binding domain-containing protein [Tabrizicola rongguiensis]